MNRRRFNQLAGMAGMGALMGRNAVSAAMSAANSVTGSSQAGNRSAARGRGMGDGCPHAA